MADLTYLNEGAVLHNLKQRYYYKLIYVSIRVQNTTNAYFLSFSLSFVQIYASSPFLSPLGQKISLMISSLT